MLDGVELSIELVVNLWPIVDSATEIIQRFAARAYAMSSADSVISGTLKSLARTDFVLAHQFPIPPRFMRLSEHGELRGAVTLADFNSSQASIAEDALKNLESDLPNARGIGLTSRGRRRPIQASFPREPFFVVTFLAEDAAGNLSILSLV